MKIDSTLQALGIATTQDQPGAPAFRPAEDPGNTTHSSLVQLSALSSTLRSLEQGLNDTHVAGPANVEQIKQAIQQGRFKVNANVVADRLLDTVRELIRSNKA